MLGFGRARPLGKSDIGKTSVAYLPILNMGLVHF